MSIATKCTCGYSVTGICLSSIKECTQFVNKEETKNNMLEQIKQDLANQYAHEELNNEFTNKVGNYYSFNSSFKDGFDACMDLELPIKFVQYLRFNYSTKQRYEDYLLKGNIWRRFETDEENTTKEIFNYWINNVYESNSDI